MENSTQCSSTVSQLILETSLRVPHSHSNFTQVKLQLSSPFTDLSTRGDALESALVGAQIQIHPTAPTEATSVVVTPTSSIGACGVTSTQEGLAASAGTSAGGTRKRQITTTTTSTATGTTRRHFQVALSEALLILSYQRVGVRLHLGQLRDQGSAVRGAHTRSGDSSAGAVSTHTRGELEFVLNKLLPARELYNIYA